MGNLLSTLPPPHAHTHSQTSHTHTHTHTNLTPTNLTGQDPPLSEWEFIPHIGPRPTRGFVGLKNAGATCYMNAVLQQVHTHTHTYTCTTSAAIPAQPVAQPVKHRLRSLVVAGLSST